MSRPAVGRGAAPTAGPSMGRPWRCPCAMQAGLAAIVATSAAWNARPPARGVQACGGRPSTRRDGVASTGAWAASGKRSRPACGRA